MRAVTFDEFGGPEVLKVVEAAVPDPGAGQVRISVEAVGVNRADSMLRTNTYAYLPSIPGARIGCEAVGIVNAVGEGVDRFAIGDPVTVTAILRSDADGSYADQIVVPAEFVIARPGNADPVTAAALWVSYSTAYGALVESARMRPGQHVLITAASSSVGLAAIQIANHLGAIPIAATRSNTKAEALSKAGAAHVVVTDGNDLAARVKELTGGKGADIVFDPIAGPGLPATAAAATYGGTVVLYGWLDTAPALLPMTWPLTIICYVSFDHSTDPAARDRIAAFLDAGLRTGTIEPTIDSVFTLDHIVDAHQRLESNDQFGKIVVTI